MSLSILLVAYLFLMVLWALFSALIIGHLLRYGGLTKATVAPTILYLTTSVFLGAISFALIANIDWQAPLYFLAPY